MLFGWTGPYQSSSDLFVKLLFWRWVSHLHCTVFKCIYSVRTSVHVWKQCIDVFKCSLWLSNVELFCWAVSTRRKLQQKGWHTESFETEPRDEDGREWRPFWRTVPSGGSSSCGSLSPCWRTGSGSTPAVLPVLWSTLQWKFLCFHKTEDWEERDQEREGERQRKKDGIVGDEKVVAWKWVKWSHS